MEKLTRVSQQYGFELGSKCTKKIPALDLEKKSIFSESFVKYCLAGVSE
jgi:hypothetical protein